MADLSKIGCDSFRLYFSGAASAGDAQTDPTAALGGFCSSTEEKTYDVTISSAIAGVSVLYVSANVPQTGSTIEVVDSTTLKMLVDGVSGDDVTIADGNTVQLNMNAEDRPDQFIRVSRSGAISGGPASLSLSVKLNNLLGLSDVSSADAASGLETYRMVFFKNETAVTLSNLKIFLPQLGTTRVSASAQLSGSGAGTITISSGSFEDWPESGYCRIEQTGGTLREIVYYASRTSTSLSVPSSGRGLLGTSAAAGAGTDNLFPVPGIRLGLDDDGVQDATFEYATIADENTAPTSVSTYWASGTTSDDSIERALSVATIGAGKILGIWVHQEVPAGCKATVSRKIGVSFVFDGPSL